MFIGLSEDGQFLSVGVKLIISSSYLHKHKCNEYLNLSLRPFV